MSSFIEVLQQIQKVDLEIKEVEEEEKNFRSGIEKISKEIKNLEGDIEVIQGEHDELDGVVKAINEEIRESTERAEKDEGKIGDITSDKALKALTKGISSAKKMVKGANERLDRITPELDEKKADLDSKNGELEEKNAELVSITAEMEAKSKDWEKIVAEKKNDKDSIAADISPTLLKKYETIRSRRGGVGLAQIKTETCQGCFMHVPPQLFIKLQRGDDELMSCPNCHRILYFIPEETS
ncbi:MAG: C4-type zinc ribbon domain-containing protein [Thermodesulfobacteriota bacterium]